MRRSALLSFLVLATLGPRAEAQPATAGCVSSIDELEALVADLGLIARASAPDRKALAEKLVAIVRDPDLRGVCEKDSVRYDAAKTLYDLAQASLGGADKAYYLDAMLEAAEAEADPVAKRQMAINLDRLTPSMTTNQKTRAAALTEEYLPTSPHYETVFGKDGKKTSVNVVVHTANQENRFDYYKRTFRGAKKIEEKDGNLHITFEVQPDDPTGRYEPVTYNILVKDEHRGSSTNFDIFDKMDKDDPAIEVLNYHSNYGSTLSPSIRNGAENPDSKKIYFLGNCKSHVNAGRIAARYPKLGGFYTIDSQYMTDTPPTLKQLLKELVNRPTWSQINRSMAYANLGQDDNYLMPNDRRLLAYLDSDFDGIPDLYDTGSNCGLKTPASATDFAPAEPLADSTKLNGEKILYAVTAANGILGYTELTEDLANRFVADGFAPADRAGPRFLLTPARVPDGAGGMKDVVKVRVNAAYSHLSDTAMAGGMLREFVLYDRSKNGRTPSLDDKILAYEMGVKLFDSWENQGGSAAYEGFQKAYNLGRNISLWEASSRIDHDRGVTKETIDFIKSKLQRTNTGGSNG